MTLPSRIRKMPLRRQKIAIYRRVKRDFKRFEGMVITQSVIAMFVEQTTATISRLMPSPLTVRVNAPQVEICGALAETGKNEGGAA